VKTKILIIYTGGTIGMVMDLKSNTLVPFDFEHLYKQVPELEKFDLELSVNSFEAPIDSSDMSIDAWQKMATIIQENYHLYDGFVILHGSDTMAYTASALSFMLNNLAKPVILTGSQLPIGMIRTDGKENLITAIEIAGAKHNNLPVINEVAIYFEYKLYRGNRTHKYNAEHFDAFKSPNYAMLAEAGIKIEYNQAALFPKPVNDFNVRLNMDGNIGAGDNNFVFASSEVFAKIKFNPNWYNLRFRLLDPYGNVINFDVSPTKPSDSVFGSGIVDESLIRMTVSLVLTKI
jgi:L-asparaginase